MKSAYLLLIVLLLPFSSWAMAPLTDSELSDINGQAGVSIMPNVSMDIHFDVIAWGDSDGLGTSNVWGVKTTGGYFGVTDLTIRNLCIRPRTDTYVYNMLYPMTIDVSKFVPHAADDFYFRMNLGDF